MDVVMVRERSGMLFFLVRRIEAWLAFCADFNARCKFCSGTSRLIVLFSAADWIEYVSNIWSLNYLLDAAESWDKR
mgnify:CR=1 FL=1